MVFASKTEESLSTLKEGGLSKAGDRDDSVAALVGEDTLKQHQPGLLDSEVGSLLPQGPAAMEEASGVME